MKFKTNNTHIHIHTHNTPGRNTHKHKAKQSATKHILGATNWQQKGGREGRRGEVGNQVIKRLYILSASQLLCAMAKKKSRENEVPSTQQR